MLPDIVLPEPAGFNRETMKGEIFIRFENFQGRRNACRGIGVVVL
jgi:hypothetical protein